MTNHNKSLQSPPVMAKSNKPMTIAEHCEIPPLPPLTVLKPPLPLTFFDAVFLRFPPVQRLFFFDHPHPNSQFLSLHLPNLKHSLALTLRHFHPLAGTLLLSTENPEVRSSANDSVHFTVAVSHGSFFELSGDHPRHVVGLRALAPPLASSGDETAVLAVQVTVFPNVGICIGTTVHHAVADGSTYANFMKAWAWSCSFGPGSANLPMQYSPCFDRSPVRDPRGLKSIFLKDLEASNIDHSLETWDLCGEPHTVLSTFVFGKDLLKELGRKTSSKCSPYSLACGYIWSCLIKTRGGSGPEIERFGFVTGCRPRHDPPLPAAFFGNCLGVCCVAARRTDLIQENGSATAAEAIWKVIKGLEGGVFRGAENWIKNVSEYASAKALTVAGSPKLGIYEVDFGWGRPRKVEIVSIERTGALSLAESGDGTGGIEVGIVLKEDEMDKFAKIFADGLLL